MRSKLEERGIDKLYYVRSNEDVKADLIERGHYNLAAKVGEPTKHHGHGATALEGKGVRTELGDHNREVKERNRERERKRDARDDRLGDSTLWDIGLDLVHQVIKNL